MSVVPIGSCGECRFPYRVYRVPGRAWILRSGKSSTRSCFQTARGSLLPEAATGNSRARTDAFPAAGGKARNLVKAIGQPAARNS